MDAVREQPLLTTVTTLPDFLPEVGSAYLFGTSVEDRSAHSSDWEGRAKGVQFIRLSTQEATSFAAEIDGVLRTVQLRSREQLAQFWAAIPSGTVYLDITGLSHQVWAPLLRAGIAVKRIIGVYVEPADYRPSSAPTESEIFDLSEMNLGPNPPLQPKLDQASERSKGTNLLRVCA